MSGYTFERQTPKQLVGYFGEGFVNELIKRGSITGQKIGPIRSIYGFHYVWISATEAEKQASFEEVKHQIHRELQAITKQEALKQAIATLSAEYEVIL